MRRGYAPLVRGLNRGFEPADSAAFFEWLDRGETFEVGDVYTQVLPTFAGRRLEYTRIIDRRDELAGLSWSCPTTGGFQHWLLTSAQGGTFVDI